MLEDNLNQRKQQYDAELGRIAMEENRLEARLKDIRSQGASIEGAIHEINNVLRDIHNEAAASVAEEL